MNKVLNYVFLDNSIQNYLLVAGVIFAAILFKRYLSRYIASGLLFRIIKQIVRGVDKESFVRLVVSPVRTFLLLLISIIALARLNFPHLLDIKIYRITLSDLADGVSVIVLIASFIWLLLRIIDFIALILNQKTEDAASSEKQLVVFFKDLFKVLFVIMGILLILKFAFRYQISNLITALSIGGAALALSFRESLENLIASFIIFFDKPFMVGNVVKVHEVTGTVEKIGLRSTRIRTDQKTFVTVPNKQMVDSIMDNLTMRTQRRAFVQLELHADTSHETVNQFVQRVRNIMQERKEQIESNTVFLSDINKNAFFIHIEFFTAPIPIADFNAVRQDVNLAVIELMEEMNIKLASKDDMMSRL